MQFDVVATRAALARHERVAFQFSGGRDSTAALYLMREFWPLMTVYFLDTGDHFKTTREAVARVEIDVEEGGGRMVRIRSDSKAIRDQFGMPSDVVPVDNHEFIGRLVSGRTEKIQSRYECCFRSIMLPLHSRMVADGITLIVRGQRDDEYATPPLRSGDVSSGFEFLYPVQGWDANRISAYIEEHGLPVTGFYAYGAQHGSDCLTCTAWMDDGRADFMRAHHPAEHAVILHRLRSIRSEVERQLTFMDKF